MSRLGMVAALDHLALLLLVVFLTPVWPSATTRDTNTTAFRVATVLPNAHNPTDIFIDDVANVVYYVSNAAHYIGRLALPTACDEQAAGNATVIAGQIWTPGFNDSVGVHAAFHNPFGIAGDGNGTIFVGDMFNHRIRKLVRTAAGDYEAFTLAGNSLSGNDDNFGDLATFRNPGGIALDPTRTYLFVADSGNAAIRRVTVLSGKVITLVVDILSTPIAQPIFVAVSMDGNFVYFTDSNRNHAAKVSAVPANAMSIASVAGIEGVPGFVDNANGEIPSRATIRTPRGIAVTPDESLVVVVDFDSNALRVARQRDGALVTLVGNGTTAAADSYRTIAFTSTPVPTCGNPEGVALWKYDTSSSFLSIMWAEYDSSHIRCLNVSHAQLFAPSILYATAELEVRDVVDLDPYGGIADLYVHPLTGDIYATLNDNNSIVRCEVFVDSMATLCHTVVAGQDPGGHQQRNSDFFTTPLGITGDGESALYIADFGGKRVRQLNLSSNNVTTVAGTGIPGANDGPGVNASFWGPEGIALHSSTQTLFVSDSSFTLLRKIDLSSPLYTVTTISGVHAKHFVFTPDDQYLFMVSPDCGNLLRMNVLTEEIVDVAGGSVLSSGDQFGASAQFNSSQSIAFLGDDYGWPCLYILEDGANTLREIRLRDQYVRTIPFSNTSVSPGLNPRGMVPYRNTTTNEFGLLVSTVQQHVYFIPLGRPPTGSITKSVSQPTVTATLSASHQGTTTHTPTVSKASISLSFATATSHTSSDTYGSKSRMSRSATSRSSTLSTLVTNSSSQPTKSALLTIATHNISLTASRLVSYGTAAQTTSIRVEPSHSLDVTSSVATPTLDATPSVCACSGALAVTQVALESVVCSLCHLGSATSTTVVLHSPPSATVGSRALLSQTITTAAVPRDVLISTHSEVIFSVALRFTTPTGGMGGSTCWLVPRVTTTPSGVLQAHIAHVFGPDGVTVMELLLQTQGPWLQDDVTLYTDTHIVLNVTLQCRLSDANAPLSFVLIEVPCPGRARSLAGEVKTAVTALQWVSVVSGPGASSSVARVAAMRSMQMCSGGDMGGIVDIRTNACDDGTSGLESPRDGITGNIVVVAASFAIALLLCLLIQFCSSVSTHCSSRAESWGVAMRSIAFPSCLAPVLTVTLPTTTGISFVLLTKDGGFPSCGANVVLGIVGLLMSLGVAAAPFVLTWWCSSRLEARPAYPAYPGSEAPDDAHDQRVQTFRFHRWWIVRHWEWWTALRYKWIHKATDASTSTAMIHQTMPTKPTEGGGDWERHASLVLHEYYILWYFALDTGVLYVAGLLVGITMSVTGSTVCNSCAIAVAVMYTAQLAVCLKLRPFTTLLGNVHGLMVLALSVVSAVLQAAHLVLVSDEAYALENTALLERLMVGSAVCDLMVMGMSGLRAVMDVMELVNSIWNIVLSLDSRRGADAPLIVQAHHQMTSRHHHASTPSGDTISSEGTLIDVNMETSEDEQEFSQAHFWNTQGHAIFEDIAEEIIRPEGAEQRPDQYEQMLQAPVAEDIQDVAVVARATSAVEL